MVVFILIALLSAYAQVPDSFFQNVDFNTLVLCVIADILIFKDNSSVLCFTVKFLWKKV